MPTKLVEPCVLAGTSERGCCAECGAPWEREVERVRFRAAVPRGRNVGGRTDGYTRAPHDGGSAYSATIGWRPTCACDAGEPIPCTVFDPFAGSGTVGVVAARHHRRFVGIELSPEYAAMARQRVGAAYRGPDGFADDVLAGDEGAKRPLLAMLRKMSAAESKPLQERFGVKSHKALLAKLL